MVVVQWCRPLLREVTDPSRRRALLIVTLCVAAMLVYAMAKPTGDADASFTSIHARDSPEQQGRKPPAEVGQDDDEGAVGDPEPRADERRDDAHAAAIADVKEKTSKHEEDIAALKAEIERLKTVAHATAFPEVQARNEFHRKRILITGGAGFVGSHLVDYLMLQGHEVTVLDNFFTGRKKNVQHWIGHPNFELVNHDVVLPYMIEVDEIYHLASPASPPLYQYNPIHTIKTNTIGTINMLGLAKRVGARLLMASTSEIYGDPAITPQSEDYWGNVNPIGPRACYDEAKRVAETLCYAYEKQSGVEVRVVRIFNTFGPRMHLGDGRVVSNFIIQALQDQPITVYGDGKQTRSFQYVSDLVNGLVSLMNSNVSSPVNIGNPAEYTVIQFAELIKGLVGSDVEVIHKESVTDDPRQRRPDIRKAKSLLGWEPKVSVEEGLKKTIEYFRKELDAPSVKAKAGEHGVVGPYARVEIKS